MWLIISLFVAGACILVIPPLITPFVSRVGAWKESKEKGFKQEYDQMFLSKSTVPKLVTSLYFVLPLVFGIVGYIFFNTFVLAIVGAVLGLVIPKIIIQREKDKRISKFDSQIVNFVMLLSSCLKGGLSIIQALEVAAEEMPAPTGQEIGLVVRENRMGVSLEESLRRLYKRKPIKELELLINSIVVARETGGNLTKVLTRLVTTIRDNQKLRETIKTLTLQGRLQGIIMSCLPFVFAWWVMNFNKEHFKIMFETETGKRLLVTAGVLQVIGMILIHKFSKIEV